MKLWIVILIAVAGLIAGAIFNYYVNKKTNIKLLNDIKSLFEQYKK